MNIPCEKCKAIRAFSGAPLKCGVCGWECGFASRAGTDVPTVEADSVWTGEEKVARGTVLKVGLCAALIAGAVYVLAQFLAPGKRPDVLTPGKYSLALKYNLTEDQVFMDAKPEDCDFTSRPAGDKHCHYEQSLNVVRECPEANCAVKRVYVSWRKIKD